MKVLLVQNLYGRHTRGGAERVVEMIAQGLEANGHHVVVFTAGEFTGFRSLWPRVDAQERQRVYRFFPFNLFSIVNIGRYPKWLRFFWHVIDALNDHPAWALLWVIRRERPDVVWTHNLKGLGGWIPSLLRWRKIPHIHHLHDVQLIEPSGIMTVGIGELRIANCGLLKRIYRRLNQRVMGSPTLVVSPTRWLLDLHRQQGFFQKSKTFVLPHPTPSCEVRKQVFDIVRAKSRTTSDKELLDSASLRSKNINGKSLINLLFAGQLAEHKGIQFLIDTLKTSELPFVWKLHIAGTGTLEETLRTATAGDPRFIFHGRLSAEPFERVWSQTNLTIVPSLCLENAPTVIAESLSRGIPALASAVGGIPEMVKGGEQGWLFAAGDQDDFVKKLFIAVQCIQRGFQPEVPHLSAPSGYVSAVLAAVRMDEIPRRGSG